MGFEWDAKKATINRTKHGIDFADAVLVFYDDLAITVPDDDPREERFVTLGQDALGRLLVVVYAWRGTHTHHIRSAGDSSGATTI